MIVSRKKPLQLRLPLSSKPDPYGTGFWSLLSMLVALGFLLIVTACTTQPVSLNTGTAAVPQEQPAVNQKK